MRWQQVLKVFLVDDEPFILDGLQTIINWNEYGMEIAGQAGNGLDALNYISRNRIDILMTDITMPVMNGIELIESVKKISPDIRYIVFSGYNDFEYVREGIKLGIENYLLKPLNVHELVSTLQNTAMKIHKSAITEAYIKRDREILRDNILYRWVTNSIDPSELSERAEIADINLGYSYYAVSLIKVLPDTIDSAASGTMLHHHAIYEVSGRCRSLTGQTGCAISFCNLDGDIVIIYGTDSGTKSRCGVNEFIEEVNANLHSMAGMSFVITCGSLQPSFLNIHISYENAKKLLEYRLVYNGEVIDYDCIQKISACRNADLDIDYNALSIMLVNGRTSDVPGFINKVFENLAGFGNIAPDVIINCSMEIISHINETINEFGGSSETEEWSYRDLISGLSDQGSIVQLKKYLETAACKAIGVISPGRSRISPVIRQVINYVNTHYHEDIGLKALAELFKKNPVYLGQLFQKETGELFTDYVNKFKMKKAREMLLNSSMKVAEISRKVGYSNSNYFCTQFRKFMGISPSEVRELQNIKIEEA